MSLSLATPSATPTETLEVITLRVGKQRLAVDIRFITEINTRLRPFPAPVATPYIAGVLNLRGEVVTVLRMSVLLGSKLPITPKKTDPTYALIRVGDERVAIEVDEVDNVQAISVTDIQPLPNNIPAHIATIANGVVPQQDGMLLMLDVARLFSLEEPKTKTLERS